MNNKLLKQHIEKTRSYNSVLLDAAVSKGIRRAKGDQLDFKKLFGLGVACLIVAVLCISVNTMPIKIMTENYFQNRYEIISDSGKALEEYINHFTSNVNEN